MEGKFTAVYEKRSKYWIAYVEELPGANTQGRTLKEARENLQEAIQLVIEANQELSRRHSAGDKVIREEIRVAL
jgi:predicted RNase H-like HicB family nuclease